MAISIFATALTMTWVHDRVPSQETYPPLPDIFLDNLPFMPWAFALAEYILIVLGTIFALVLVFHRYRLIVCRRIFVIGVS